LPIPVLLHPIGGDVQPIAARASSRFDVPAGRPPPAALALADLQNACVRRSETDEARRSETATAGGRSRSRAGRCRAGRPAEDAPDLVAAAPTPWRYGQHARDQRGAGHRGHTRPRWTRDDRRTPPASGARTPGASPAPASSGSCRGFRLRRNLEKPAGGGPRRLGHFQSLGRMDRCPGHPRSEGSGGPPLPFAIGAEWPRQVSRRWTPARGATTPGERRRRSRRPRPGERSDAARIESPDEDPEDPGEKSSRRTQTRVRRSYGGRGSPDTVLRQHRPSRREKKRPFHR